MKRPRISETLSADRTTKQFRRLFDLLLVINQHKKITTAEVSRIMKEDIGVVFCKRTLSRDLAILRSMALIESTYNDRGTVPTHRSNVKIEFVE